ncbi:MAG: hypothetical protein ACYC9O_15660 [Candidatus Latescibacterota bacterium]
MKKALVLALWVFGLALGGAALESAPGALTGTAGSSGEDSSVTAYRDAEPVIEYVERTRPRAVPAIADRYQGIKRFLVNAVLAIAAAFSLYLVLQYRKLFHGDSAGGSSCPGQTLSGERAIPKATGPGPKLPGTPFERACHLKELRAVHTAAIERLFKRI